MFTLTAGNTIGAVADVANQVTMTVLGQVLDAASAISGSTTENYNVLAQSQIAAAAATVYTVPASKSVNVKSIFLVNNNTTTPMSVQLYLNGLVQANAITNLVKIPENGMGIYEDGKGWTFHNSAAQILTSVYSQSQQKSPNNRISGHLAESIDRMLCPEVNTTVAASGTLFMQGIYLQAGMVINNIWLHSATTAASAPTNYRAGLYDSSRSLLAQSADQLTAAWAANTLKQLPLTAAFTIPSDGLYYIGYYMAATTAVPTLKGGTAKTGGQLSQQTPALHGTSSTGLTTALPNPAAVLVLTTASIWAGVS